MNELVVNQVYSFAYLKHRELLWSAFFNELLICTILLNWFVYGVAILYDADWIDWTLVKTGIQFHKKDNLWLSLGIWNSNNIHVNGLFIGFGKDIIVLFRYSHLLFHQFLYFCSFLGFSLILTEYIGVIYLIISVIFLRHWSIKIWHVYQKGHEHQRMWISCNLPM